MSQLRIPREDRRLCLRASPEATNLCGSKPPGQLSTARRPCSPRCGLLTPFLASMCLFSTAHELHHLDPRVRHLVGSIMAATAGSSGTLLPGFPCHPGCAQSGDSECNFHGRVEVRPYERLAANRLGHQ